MGGCMCGVKSVRTGLPIKKPWKFLLDDPKWAESFRNHRCRGEHTHTPCAGTDTEKTGFYTKFLADLILKDMQHDRDRVPAFAGGSDSDCAGLVATPGLETPKGKSARIKMHLDRLKAHQEKLQRHGKPQPHRVKDPVEPKPFDPYEDMWCSLVTLALSPRDP